MPLDSIEYLTEAEILAVYNRVVERYMASDDAIKFAGLMLPDRLKASVERPKTQVGDHDLFPCVYCEGSLLRSLHYHHASLSRW